MKARRILCLLCILSMIFLLCSCSISNDSEIQSKTSAKVQTTTTETGTATTEHTTDKSESTTSSTLTSTTASVKSSVSKATAKKSVTKKRTKKSVKSTTASITTATTTAVTQYCTVTIECKSVLDNMSSLKSGHSEYVPENGYILQNYKCPCQPDLTAYDLLKQSCDENGIKLTASKSGYGIYVKGINNLDEFDCGNESGWLYYVNGKKPPVSCDKYTVSSGDEIVFSYTCDY